MEHYGLNIAEDPEMFRIGYFDKIFFEHLYQAFTVTVEPEPQMVLQAVSECPLRR